MATNQTQTMYGEPEDLGGSIRTIQIVDGMHFVYDWDKGCEECGETLLINEELGGQPDVCPACDADWYFADEEKAAA